MFRLITPTTDAELAAYYEFRWRMLRKPWQLPRGAERDAYDDGAFHRMIVDDANEPVAVGRLYVNPDSDGQIRYLAVQQNHQKRGLGGLILMALESLARQENAARLVCNATESSLGFFHRNGFSNKGELTAKQGSTAHQQMVKTLEQTIGVLHRPECCQALLDLWQRSMPISNALGVKINGFTGYRFELSAPLVPNANPMDTLFSGCAFSLATLTGWGMLWLLLKERGLVANIMLVDGHIRYRKPIRSTPKAVVSLDSLRGDLDRLVKQNKARVSLDVTLLDGDEIVGTFSGAYMLIAEQ